jgi:hypoxanthine phosphoribosyltransferase
MTKPVPDDVLKVRESADLLFDRESVDRAVDRLAVRLSLKMVDAHPVVICVMTGGLVLTADLLKRFHFPLEVDYVHATRYAGGTSGGALEVRVLPATDVRGRTVLVVDDIVDRGTTLASVKALLEEAGAARVLIAVLVDKMVAGPRPIEVDYAALRCPDRYVFGHGMDYHGYWRNLAGIYALRES